MPPPPTEQQTPFAGRGGLTWRLRRTWRLRLRPRWRDVRGPLVVGLAILVYVFGLIGFMSPGGGDLSFAEAAYKSFQLFAFAGGDVSSDAPLVLNIARFLGPLVVGYAAIKGVLALSREQLRRLGFRVSLRGHVVVAGLGDVGFGLATSLNEAGARVVVIERDANNPSLEGCRERGISVLVGDATDADVLDTVRATHAAHLIAACGDDATTIDVVAAARSLVGDARSRLAVFAQIESRPLWQALAARTLSESGAGGPRLELFNVYEAATRLMLAEHPPFAQAAADASGPVLIAVDPESAETLVLNLARLWRNVRTSPRRRLALTIAADDADAIAAALEARHPALAELCEVEPWTVDFASAESAGDPRAAEATVSYVSRGDEGEAVVAALAISAANRTRATTVLAVKRASAGAARLIGAQEDPPIAVFGVLTRALAADFVFRGLNETLARAMHESYVQTQLAIDPANPSLVPWAELPESLRASNRRFAEGVGPKLEAVGLLAVPAPLADIDGSQPLAEVEIERLARLEHERWAQDLIADGWRSGPAKDPEAKFHPLLVDWEQLSEPEREKDRDAVRALPRMLAEAGFELHRTHAATAQSP